MKHLLSILTLALLLPIAGNAQKLKLTKGSLAPLKGETQILVEFDYSEFGVGRFKEESEYVKQKQEEYNQKEPGRGDKWRQAWDGDKDGRFPASFIQLYNKWAKKSPIINTTGSDFKYKMIVKITFMEPGFNIYVAKKYASINLIISYVALSNPSEVIAEVVLTGAAGRTYGMNDYDTGLRISEAFALAGKSLSRFTDKLLK